MPIKPIPNLEKELIDKGVVPNMSKIRTKREKKWFEASVDYLVGFGHGFRTKMAYVKAVSERMAKKRIKTIFECRYGRFCIYNLGSEGNRGINGLMEWK